MGEVYRALDTQLDREVAVKVLPYSMASDPERLARFDREAKILAALNHPNIAVIYGMEKFEGGRALVMELVPGDTLGARIKKGAMAQEEALQVARQMAEALEAAHEKGVTHRDLKPGNVMITPGGVVKVLDFGLAAMASPAAMDSENSPTLTMGMTAAGTIMGTAAYMSPEQASGLQVDKRSDIWSYGAVLWEMLTGKRLFAGGESLSHTLADVLRAPIDFEKVPAGAVQKLLKRCLDRSLKTRLQAIAEARIAIDEMGGAGLQPAGPRQAEGLPHQSKILVAIAAGALIGAALLAWQLWRTPAAPDRPLTRLSVDLGPGAERQPRVTVILSPDGTRIVYTVKATGGLHQLYTRRLDQPNATLLAPEATIDFEPFFSPDGEWVGFWYPPGGKIMKVAAQGGTPIPIGEFAGATVNGASWGDDDSILIGSTNGLWRMPAAGGTPEKVKGTTGVQIFPQFLPGAKAALLNGFSTTSRDLDGAEIEALRLDTGERKTLIRGGYWPRYMPTSGATGHLVFMRAGALYAVGFDPRSLELLGTPTALLDDVASSPDRTGNGGGQFAFSNTGTFVYLSGRAQGGAYPISWLDASGKTVPLLAQAGTYGAPRISPDGKLVAYLGAGGKGSDLWVYDVGRGTPTQLTFTGGLDSEVAWARDSKHLVYNDGSTLWWIRADGAGQRQALLEKAQNPRPTSFAPDGRLVFSPSVATLPNVVTFPIDLTDPEHPKPGKAEPFLADPNIVEVDPMFSPDGKFIAYSSNESGDEEVFVRPFPGPGGKWKVSTKGGKFPVWSAPTHELFFVGSDDRIWTASYTTQGDSFSAGVPRVWSPTQVRRNSVQQNFDVSPDGKRVIMFPRPVAEESGGNLHATFLLNFFYEVRRRVPVK
jgi:Tol biopolymer transport system component